MWTFIGQLIGFAVIAFILWRYVVPPVRADTEFADQLPRGGRTILPGHRVVAKWRGACKVDPA